MERRAPAQSSSRDQCTRSPSSRNNTNTIAVQVLLMHLFHTLYTRYAGIAHHRALQTSGRGWADSKAVHGMECNGGAHALLEVSLSRGSCLMCTVLPVQEGVLSHTTECETSQRTINNNRPPVLCPGGIYIAGNTLRHQPMGAGHMTVL